MNSRNRDRECRARAGGWGREKPRPSAGTMASHFTFPTVHFARRLFTNAQGPRHSQPLCSRSPLLARGPHCSLPNDTSGSVGNGLCAVPRRGHRTCAHAALWSGTSAVRARRASERHRGRSLQGMGPTHNRSLPSRCPAHRGEPLFTVHFSLCDCSLFTSLPNCSLPSPTPFVKCQAGYVAARRWESEQ